MLYIKVSVQEQQKSTKSSEVCRERKNVAEKSRRQTIKTGTSKDTDAPSIMNGNAEVIIVRFKNHCLIVTVGSRNSRTPNSHTYPNSHTLLAPRKCDYLGTRRILKE